MKAILVKAPGGPEQLHLGEVETPVPGKKDLLIKVACTALNRADILQRQGKYPPPEGESTILGLELSGTVEEAGASVSGCKKGDKIFALLAGGGYAQYAVIPADMAMRIPDNLSFEEAAAIPEAFLTAYLALHRLGGLSADQNVLIHAGASGVGSAAIQLVNAANATALVTVGSAAKAEFCCRLGAEAAFNYKEGKFAGAVLEKTAGHGADIIVDCVGASFFEQNLECLATDGKIILLSTMGGPKVESLSLVTLLRKRASIIASTLRSRSREFKAELTREFAREALPGFDSGRLKAVIDKVFSWTDVAEAHRYMEENRNMGKVVLRVA